MEWGEIQGVMAIIVAIFLSTGIYIWQLNSQAGRMDSRIDRLEDKIDTQGRELRAEIETQGKELRAEIEAQGLRMEAQGQRVSQSELEQARLNGVNSVLIQHIHTHEPMTGSD
ncbi:MAG: hypothetical protein F4Z35_04410 [Dehalococcoidia bacterium]|nr:hypothetical protein [Dehalococcoidia bacterium]